MLKKKHMNVKHRCGPLAAQVTKEDREAADLLFRGNVEFCLQRRTYIRLVVVTNDCDCPRPVQTTLISFMGATLNALLKIVNHVVYRNL